MDAIETIHKGDYTIKIYSDDDPENPRDNDNLGQMICFHRRANYGDKHNYSVEDVQRMINSGEYFWLPIYAYEHGGITISTGRGYPFNDVWDSGQLGVILVSKAAIRKEWKVSRISPKLEKTIMSNLQAEVDVYDDYLTGAVYGYEVEYEGEEIDSCWGFYGNDHKKSGLMEYAQNAIDCHHKTTMKQLKLF